MPQITRADLDEFNGVLEVTIHQSDYEQDYQKALNKYRNEAQFKGFRKGKTPMGMIKKLYGPNLLVESVTGKLQAEIDKYLKEEKPAIIGYPIEAENQEKIDFDPNNLKDYSFKFEMGLLPEFELKGAQPEDTYDFYEVKVTDQMVDQQWEDSLNSIAQPQTVEGPIIEKDYIKLSASQKEGETPLTHTFSLLVDDALTEETKSTLLGKNKGFSFESSIYQLEKEATPQVVHKYFLGLEDGAELEGTEHFQLEIVEITRRIKPEPTQETFDQLFGKDEVDSVENAKIKIKEFIENHRFEEATILFYNQIQEVLEKENKFPLPDAFIRKFLPLTNEDITEENIESDYEKYADSIRWSIVKERLLEKHEIKVENSEILQHIRGKIRQMLGNSPGMGADFIDNLTQRMVQDKAQVQEAISGVQTDKLAKALRDTVKLKKKKVSSEEFQKIIEESTKKLKEQQS
jgi:trigger factor